MKSLKKICQIRMFLNKRCNYEFITTCRGAEGRCYPVRWELQNNFIMFNLHFPSFIIFIIYAGLQIWFLVQKDQTNLIIANISIFSFWLYCICSLKKKIIQQDMASTSLFLTNWNTKIIHYYKVASTLWFKR